MTISPLPNSDIPDDEILYRYCRPEAFPKDQSEIPSSIFSDGELSCDWELFQKKPEHSPHVKSGKTVIIQIKVCDEIRNPRNPKDFGNLVPAWVQQIIYAPSRENQAHSLIKAIERF